MPIDKSWIHLKNRLSDEYWRGTDEFITLASPHVNKDGLIKCPCNKCMNQSLENLTMASAHIIDYGFDPNYTVWIYHGEEEAYPRIGDYPITDEIANSLFNLAITKTILNQPVDGSSPPAPAGIPADQIIGLNTVLLELQQDCIKIFEWMRRAYPESVQDREPPPAQPFVLPVPPVSSPLVLSADHIVGINAITTRAHGDFVHFFEYVKRVNPDAMLELKPPPPQPFLLPVPPAAPPPSDFAEGGNDDEEDDDDEEGNYDDEDEYYDDYDDGDDDDEDEDEDENDDDDDDDGAAMDLAD